MTYHWVDVRSETVPELPEIKVKEFFPGTFEAECPLLECKWFEHSNLPQEVEEKADAHKQWHEDGMPE